MTANERTLTGGCQCGAIRFRVSGGPVRSSICHCRMCQKAIGAPFGAFVTVDRQALEWTHGAPASFQSSNIARRGFCANCGTPLTWEPLGGKDRDIVDLATFAFDDPGALAPAEQVCVESRAPWLLNLASLPEGTLSSGDASIVSLQHPDRETGEASSGSKQ